jgi:hypothetical protein
MASSIEDVVVRFRRVAPCGWDPVIMTLARLISRRQACGATIQMTIRRHLAARHLIVWPRRRIHGLRHWRACSVRPRPGLIAPLGIIQKPSGPTRPYHDPEATIQTHPPVRSNACATAVDNQPLAAPLQREERF